MEKTIVFCVLLGMGSTVFADTVVFQDDFEGEGPMGSVPYYNYNSFEHWDVIDGTVDLMCPNSYGHPDIFVDLCGQSPGWLQTNVEFVLSPGSYVLSFDLAGRSPIEKTR